jgi:osmotically-inducible protein OsmY
MGWLSDKLFGKRKSIDPAHIQNLMKPSKDMMNEQIGWSRQMMDPNSEMNMRMRNLMAQRSAESGAQAAQQMQKMGAMTGMSAGQAAMQQRMAMNQATGGVNQQWQSGLQGQLDKGMGLFGQMQQEMKSYNQADVNAYMGQINAHNQRRAGRQGMGMQLAGGLMSALSDKRLKKNINLVGKSPKGHNIYEFEYKDKFYGKGRFRGVMAQEVPNASFKGYDGYLRVNYDKIDVDFERII